MIEHPNNGSLSAPHAKAAMLDTKPAPRPLAESHAPTPIHACDSSCSLFRPRLAQSGAVHD